MKRWVHYGGASALALGIIAGYEGYRSTAYDDGGGVQTIGFGSTTTQNGAPVRAGTRTDPVRAVIKLASDADTAAQRLSACIGDVPLSQNEWDAYTSWAYNIGTGAACRSTLVKLLKQTPPDYAGACAQLLRWDTDNGVRIPGLTARRESEYRLCMGGTDAQP